MKKLATLVMAGAMMASLMSVASAERLSIPVRCDSTTNYTNNSETALKESGSAAIYVYHHDNVDTEEYTNHFRGQLVNGSTRTTKGSKWCTQGLNVPIQNNNIVSGRRILYLDAEIRIITIMTELAALHSAAVLR